MCKKEYGKITAFCTQADLHVRVLLDVDCRSLRQCNGYSCRNISSGVCRVKPPFPLRTWLKNPIYMRGKKDLNSNSTGGIKTSKRFRVDLFVLMIS